MNKVILGALILLFASVADAAIITETWTAKVWSLSNNALSDFSRNVSYNGYRAGDFVSWSVTYDSLNNDRISIYNDGIDGKADRGGNDDTLDTLYCFDQTVSSVCASTVLSSAYALFNSVTDTSLIYQTMIEYLKVGEVVHDYFNSNADIRKFQTEPYPDFTASEYQADDFKLYADNRHFPSGGAGYAQLFYKKTDGEVWVSRIGFGNINYTSVITSVPEPSILVLMISGLLGLGITHRRNRRI